jgi:hypothetical protein
MAWPTNKPDSNKFSADTNSIKESRPEIKTMSDAVNDIVDFIDTTGIDGDPYALLVYNRANSQVEVAHLGNTLLVNEDSGGAPLNITAAAGVTNPLTSDLDTDTFNIKTNTGRGTDFKISKLGGVSGDLRLESAKTRIVVGGTSAGVTNHGISVDAVNFVIDHYATNVQSENAITFNSHGDSAGSTENFDKITVTSDQFNIDAGMRYKEQVFELPYGVNITPDVKTNGNLMEITLTGSVTFQGFASAENGQSLTLIIKQDGTGNRTFTEDLDSAGRMLFAGGTSTLSTAANAIDIMTISFVGGIYYASLSTNFS